MNSKTKIEQLLKLYKDTFPMGWIDDYTWDEEHSGESWNNVSDKVHVFEQEAFYLFA